MPDDGIPGKFGYLVAMACQESSDEPFDSGNTIPLPDFPVLEPNSAFTTEPLTNARSFSPVLGDMEQGDDMNELSDESLFDLLYSNEMFTNGLGFSMEAVTGTFLQHVETAKRRSAFIEERVGGPSLSYIGTQRARLQKRPITTPASACRPPLWLRNLALEQQLTMFSAAAGPSITKVANLR